MNESNKLLSDIVAFRTYARYLPHLGRREMLEETINRTMSMHLDRFPKLSKDIIKAFDLVHDLKVMPSMRAMQFSGDAVLKNNARQYNCSFLPIKDSQCFGETLFLLLSGVGVGFSVQKQHIDQLPVVKMPREDGIYFVHDSIIGWAQAVDMLLMAFFHGRMKPNFNFSNIRPKGSYLVTTGAKAPGPEPLRKMLEEVEIRLKAAIGRKLRPIEVHDIVCIISDAVLAGGIRRAALLSMFDRDDSEMLKAKSGEWWVKHPYRARANNSAVLPRNEITKEEFDSIFKISQESGAGEPGFSFTNDSANLGFNPCVTGDTEILTDDGYKRIDSLVGVKTNIWNGFEWSSVTPSVTGKNQELVKVSFSDGRTLTCTLYHSFHVSTNYRGGRDVVKAKDLQKGMKLIKHEFPVIEHGKEYKDAYLQGFISAEGMDGYNFVWVYDPKAVCLARLGGKKGKHWGNRVAVRFDKSLPKSFVPFEWNLKSKLDWLAGLFDGDGTELKEGGLQLSSVDLKFLQDLQSLLSTLGVQSKLLKGNPEGLRSMPDGKGGMADFQCQASFRICVGAAQMQHLKALGMRCERMSFDKTPNRDASQFVSVVSVEPAGVAETVYCFTEPKKNLGIFNGVLTGQCHEISLNAFQFCNLTTINQTGIKDKKDLLQRAHAAALLGTLQAAYTDFPYVRDVWKQTTEREALLGVSFTGIADAAGLATPELLEEAAKVVLDQNERYAKKIGINIAARSTAVKPEGSSSTVLGSSSGIHDRHAGYYLRRIRMNKDDALATYLSYAIPELVEQDRSASNGVVVTIPQESPQGAITRNDSSALELLKRVIKYNKHWIAPGHRSGSNMHNVSATISVKPEEWDEVRDYMWKHRGTYSGISLLPYDGGTYIQAPFEEVSKEEFDRLSKLVKTVDLREVREVEDLTNRTESIACGGGSCDIV